MANRYARTVGGNWTDNATWSTTSGGAADTVAPTASDDVFLDANSGQVTISATSVGKSLTCTGYTGTLTHNAFDLTISGSITFVAGMTYTPSAVNSRIRMNATGTLTTGGKLIWNFEHFNNAVTTLGDNYNAVAQKTAVYTVGSASTNLNGFTISGNSSTNRILVRSLTLGTAGNITNTTGTFANADFRDITLSSAADLSAITGLSGDCGGNTNITFTTAATQTATGNSANWSAATWTSRVPLPQDDVVLSLTAGQTLTADMPRIGKSISLTTAMNLTQSVAVTNYGSVDFTNLNTFNPASLLWTFEGRGAFTITSAGKTFGAAGVTVAMVGGSLTPQDAFVFYSGSGGSFILTDGSFLNSNNFSGASYKIVTDNSSRTRRLDMGNATWTLSGVDSAQQVFDNGTTTGLTFNANSSTILFSDTSATAKTFVGGGLTYNDLQIAGGGAGAVILTGSNSFNRIYTDGGGTKTIQFTAGTTTTLRSSDSNGFENGTNVITINSSSAGTAATLSKPNGRFEGNFLSIKDSTASGTFYAGANSTNVSGNSGWIFADYTPGQSGGLMAWLDALDGKDGTFTDRLTKTSYTVSGATRGANVASGTAMVFDGTNDKITMGNIGNIYSISFWITTDTTTEQWIDLNGTQAVQIASGTIAGTSWTSPTIYVNGVVTATLGANVWSHVVVTSDTAVTCSAVVIGQIGANYGAFSMTGLKMFDRILTAREVGQIYNRDRVV